MSLKYEGQSCPVCHAYLFDEDDIVHCPICGAPHHRDCYNHIGHCALEADHGTELEYSFEKARAQQAQRETPPADNEQAKQNTVCPVCHEEYQSFLSVCPKCGAPNIAAAHHFVMPDPYGAVPQNFDIGEGVTAKQAARFVLSSSSRYIPKFARLKSGTKLSWNWAAFLLPHGWMFFRKMHIYGILVAILTVAFALCIYPFNSELSQLIGADNTYIGLMTQLPDLLANVSVSAKILAGVSLGGQLIMRVICGLFGDEIYRQYTISSIQKIKEQDIELNEGYRKYGNVSPIIFLLGVFITSYLPSILLMFIL